MIDAKTPGEAAYQAWWRGAKIPAFDKIHPDTQSRWNSVADAVIRSVKTEIAKEMVKAAGVTQQRTEAQ